MKTIWIIGAGKFGLRTEKCLLKTKGHYSLTLVDQDKAALDQAKVLGCQIEIGDAINFLNKRLTRETGRIGFCPQYRFIWHGSGAG